MTVTLSMKGQIKAPRQASIVITVTEARKATILEQIESGRGIPESSCGLRNRFEVEAFSFQCVMVTLAQHDSYSYQALCPIGAGSQTT